MISILLTLELLSKAYANKPSCSDLKSRICNFLDEHSGERFFRMADGSRALNTFYDPNAKKEFFDPETTGSVGEKALSNDKLQAKLLKALEVRGISRQAQAKLADRAVELFDSVPSTIYIQKPLGGRTDKTVARPRDEVVAEVKKTLGETKFEALRALVNQNEAQLKSITADRRATEEMLSTMTSEIGELAEDQSLSTARVERIRKIFEDAKASHIAVVTGGRPRAAWTDEQKNLVARIEPLKLKIYTAEESAAEGGCKIDGIPNAFNAFESKTVELCREMLMQPDGALAFQMAHEIGHANDPCALQNDLAIVDYAKLEAFKAGRFSTPRETETLKLLIESGPAGPSGGQEAFQGRNYIGPATFARLDGVGLYKKLVDAGAIRVLAKRFEEYPDLYRKAYGCIAKKFKYRTPDATVRESRIAEKKAAVAAYANLSKAQQDEEVQSYRRFLESRKDCVGIEKAGPRKGGSGPPPQMMEAIADMFGGIYQEKFLTENPPRSEKEKMLSLFLAAHACVEKSGHVSSGVHPEDSKRIAMQADLPAMANLLDCTRDEAGCFDNLSQVRSSRNASPVETETHQ